MRSKSGRKQDQDAIATLERLIKSRHVGDLRLVFDATVCIVLAGCLLAFVFVLWRNVTDGWPWKTSHAHTAWTWLQFLLDALVSAAPVMGAIIALSGGVFAWAYQSGSGRLGIVDLYACEISTLCRVCTITDLAQRHIAAFYLDLSSDSSRDREAIARTRSAFRRFDPGETYSPVFDQHAAELKVLDAAVVTDVTAFYTYLKAMKDNLRSLAKISASPATGREDDAWHDALKSVIYMEFLAFESARKAVEALVEFEPKRVENTITILISEVPAFAFLLKCYASEPGHFNGEDFRHARLNLRLMSYRDIIGFTYHRAKEAGEYFSASRALSPSEEVRAQAWAKAIQTSRELVHCNKLLFGDQPTRPADMPPPQNF